MTEQDITWETCPTCGQRERRSDCLLGRKCRQEYDEETATALANGGEVVDMFDLAETEGKQTLENLQEELQEVGAEKTKRHDVLWRKAGSQVQANLESQRVFNITDGIRRNAKIKLFRQLRDEDDEYQRLSKKAHRLKKAVESLQEYLAELPARREECKKRREAESQQKTTIVRLHARVAS